MICGRERPYNENESTDFHFFAFSSDMAYRSMPSMHTSCTFAMMTVIAKQYNYWWIKIPAYTFAFGVAIQRIDNKQHWTSDVLVGGIIGYSIANSLVKKHNQNDSYKFTLGTFLSANSIGISLTF